MWVEKIQSGDIIQLSSGEKRVVDRTTCDSRSMYTMHLRKGKLKKSIAHIPAKAEVKVINKGGK